MTKEKKKYSSPLSVRFNEKEDELLTQLAASAGIPKSTFVKKVALNQELPKTKRKPKKQSTLSIKDREEFYRIYGALRNSGLVKVFNAVTNALVKGHAVTNAVEKSVLLAACADIQFIRKIIEKAIHISNQS